MPVLALAFSLTAVAYAGLAMAYLIRGVRQRVDYALLLATVLTALWAAAAGLSVSGPEPLTDVDTAEAAVKLMGVASSTAWGWFLVQVMLLNSSVTGKQKQAWEGISLVIGFLFVIGESLISFGELGTSSDAVAASFFIRVCLAIGGLTILENVIRNSAEESFWSLKYLGIGLGGLFAYDFFVYSQALLFRTLDSTLMEIRGGVALVVLPLIVVGTRRTLLPDRRLAISHSLAFHSAAILGGGVYLLVMGGAGYYLRQAGGDFGRMFSALFMFGSLVLLTIVVSSGRIRSWLKVWLYKNLFRYKYDYREEWLRFMDTIAAEQSGTNLRLRVIKSLANIVDSPAGALWQWDDLDQSYEMTDQWNYSSLRVGTRLEESLITFLARRRWVLDLDMVRKAPEEYNDLALSGWLLEAEDARFIVPLVEDSHILGLVVLKQPRAPRTLNWEDFDLLKMCGRQAASYLAENSAVQALSAARELEIFNRRFAFVVHDIKTSISNLSLMLSNAAKHGDNPAFQRDLIDSVRDSVETMKRLLEQINVERQRTLAPAVTDLGLLVARTASRRVNDDGARVSLDLAGDDLKVVADEQRLSAIIGHLFQNALDAAGPTGQVTIRAGRSNATVNIEVVDDGAGMAPEFVRDQLFKPFRSTKSSGYGIGAYQCRELVRELRGRMNVASTPGKGTTMRVELPAALDQSPVATQAVLQ
jgi:putative PEP-CTERM system histidine kinase